MFKKILFQIHWFVGITAGTLLMMVGITGAILSFSDEIIDVLNPGILHVQRQAAPVLDAQQIIEKIQNNNPDSAILLLTLTKDVPDSAQVRSVRVNFAPPPGQRRGDLRYADPYTGQLLPSLRAEPFFKWIEFLHRFLLLPTPTGKIVMGSTALCLFFLALSGLYMRWPRHALQWRAWFKLDFSLQGRSFLWHLHSVLGTWALVMYLISSSTGVYWSFDWARNGVDGLISEAAAMKQAKAKKHNGEMARDDAKNREKGGEKGGEKGAEKPKPAVREAWQPEQMARVWNGFVQAVPDYRSVSLRLPERTSEPVQINYLLRDAPHDRAMNRLRVNPETGEVSEVQLYADKGIGDRFLSTIYVLHLGTYFGLPGRILMMLAALCLPLFGITGWMLYLDRRRKKRAVRLARSCLDASASAPAVAAQEKVLIVFASQSGYAEKIALNTAAALQTAGLTVDLRSIARIGMEQLRHYHRALFVVSSFGDGEPPDSARGFTRQLMQEPGATLAHLQYGLLALGDRHYSHFCGYGHALDFHLQSQGAQTQFSMIEVDNGSPAALALWQSALADRYGIAQLTMAEAAMVTPAAAPYQHWQLQERKHLNPGSNGEPIFHLALVTTGATPLPHWQSGALIEILPRHAPQHVNYYLQQAGLDGGASVVFQNERCTLAEALASANLPAPVSTPALTPSLTPQEVADGLKPMTSRRYSVASITEDRSVQLLVRQSTHEGGLGIASGWLTAHASLGGTIVGRLLGNPSFALSERDVPGIFIGNGSGLAGLRSHLRARVRDGHRRNWLLFGERNRAHDALYADEIVLWQQDGFLSRIDLAFSRDQAERIYVQDKLRDAAALLREWLADGAVIYVCGSMNGMAAGVDAVLHDIVGEEGLEELIAANRYRRDIY